MSEILMEYTRGKHVENIHRGDIVVVDCNGKILSEIGNARLPMFWRSAAKPFQALPFVKSGGMEKYGLTDEELAILVSSHSGEEFHVNLIRGILKKLGLTEDALDCGAIRPMSGKAFKNLIQHGEKPQQVHNPCSGKHTQILALALMNGIPIDGYTDPNHPAQKMIFEHVAMSSSMKEEDLDIGIDGCGVPVFYLPIYNMSLAYARLGSPHLGDWGEYESAAKRIRDSMSRYPSVLSGSGRVDEAVSQITNGRIIAKCGADAVYCITVKDANMGITFKIEDGSYQATTPMVIGVLKWLDLLTKDERQELDSKYPPILRNIRGDVIGTIEMKF